jgi:hypothetical protein
MRAAAATVLMLGSVACRPVFDDRDWQIDSVRVLAVKSDPAEAKPGDPVHYTAFLSGAAAAPPVLAWEFCAAPKPPLENNAVASACLDEAELKPAGRGLSIDVATPLDSCLLFGPDTPPGGFRPRDPDSTGGYYQPLRVDLEGAVPTFHLQRVSCHLADAASDTASAFVQAYTPNRNPTLTPLLARISGQPVALAQIPREKTVELELGWSAEDAETFAYYDRASQTLTSQRESMRVAWYVDAGRLDNEVTGRAEGDLTLSSDNRWSAPTLPGKYHLWAVLRDARGGVDFARYELSVVP